MSKCYDISTALNQGPGRSYNTTNTAGGSLQHTAQVPQVMGIPTSYTSGEMYVARAPVDTVYLDPELAAVYQMLLLGRDIGNPDPVNFTASGTDLVANVPAPNAFNEFFVPGPIIEDAPGQNASGVTVPVRVRIYRQGGATLTTNYTLKFPTMGQAGAALLLPLYSDDLLIRPVAASLRDNSWTDGATISGSVRDIEITLVGAASSLVGHQITARAPTTRDALYRAWRAACSDVTNGQTK